DKSLVDIYSFGDREFFFRLNALKIQNAGDTFGRFTSLKKYNYEYVAGWLSLLDYMNNKSDFAPSLASYVYAQTQKTEDIPYIVTYLENHAEYDPEKKWWWLYQAVYLANAKLEDKEWALRIAYKISNIDSEEVPVWAKQLSAFLHESLGEKEMALKVIVDVIENLDKLKPSEIKFINYFLLERLGYLEEELEKQQNLDRHRIFDIPDDYLNVPDDWLQE
ncbi:MAG: hypothetical protein AAF195_04540, partial [Pseudomonadota bacterium]